MNCNTFIGWYNHNKDIKQFLPLKTPSCCRLIALPLTCRNHWMVFSYYIVVVVSSSLRSHGMQHAVHWVLKSIELMMPSNNLILCHPLLLLLSIFPSIRVFSNESALHIRWPKYWSFNFSVSPSNEFSGLTSFRIDWFDLAVQGTQEFSPTPQFKSINSSALSLLYGPTLTSIHDYRKNHSFWLYWPLSAKWCLCFLICCLGLSVIILLPFSEGHINGILCHVFFRGQLPSFTQHNSFEFHPNCSVYQLSIPFLSVSGIPL